jgi:transcriptional regulator of nitric oxide reductase
MRAQAIKICAIGLVSLFFVSLSQSPSAARYSEEQLKKLIIPPFSLGEKDPKLPVYALLNSAEKPTGYVFQTIDLIKIPGFSGTPVNLLVQMDYEGNFIDVKVLEHNEPVFVNGHGSLPLDKFINQYPGLSVAQNIKVQLSTQKAERSKNQIDGVAMATASVRIMNETILAASLKIARQKLKGLNTKPAAIAKANFFEKKSIPELLEQNLVKIQQFKNTDVQKIFEGSDVAKVDEIANETPNGLFSEVLLADLSVPTIAKNLLSTETYNETFKHLGETKVPVLIIAKGRHQLLNQDFTPASVPEKIIIKQNDLAINMRDTYIDVTLNKTNGLLKELEVTPEAQAYIFALDRRFGFDPASPWHLHMGVHRQKGFFHPKIVEKELVLTYELPKRFFDFPEADIRSETESPWVSSWRAQSSNLIVLLLFLITLYALLFWRQSWMAKEENLKFLRPLILLFTLIFIGWYGQAQLSIVTVIALIKTFQASPGFSFLLYDPLSTLIWLAVILSFFIWGRGTFCGWLCPYGVLQEFSAKLGDLLKVKQVRLKQGLDDKLKYIKHIILFAIVITAFIAPTYAEIIAEVEPFKTAITLYFWRSWPFMLYAAFWIILSMFIFKAFCRYACPLGAFLSLGGYVRTLNWIPRRQECGSPCQLCNVRCNYQSIKPSGKIDYSECFQCLDCVSIYDDKKTCVPLIIKAKKGENQ